MDKQKVSIEKAMALDEATGYLEELVKGFRSGQIMIEEGDKSISLTTPENVEVEVEAKVKKGKEKFSFELSWKRVIPEEPEQEALNISTEETEAPAKPAE
ncbi:MAG: amphi-Trp domain-containing protein [candidate division Zixibacteria bacterium]|nr:amphi-Trp domain-containing protein [candidate division Zixibacteria bacterium]